MSEVITRENYYDFPAVSSSELKRILPRYGGSAEKYKYKISQIDDELDGEAIRIGKICHRCQEVEGAVKMIVTDIPGPGMRKIWEESLRHPDVRKFLDATIKVGAFATTCPPEVEKVLGDVAAKHKYQINWKPKTITDKLYSEGVHYMIEYVKAESDISVVLVRTEEVNMFTSLFSRVMQLTAVVQEGHLQRRGWAATDSIENHKELAFTFDISGVLCKCLIDDAYINRTRNEIFVNDLKTISADIPFYTGLGINRGGKVMIYDGDLYKYGVDFQLAFYSMGLKNYAERTDMSGKPYKMLDPSISILETKPPYDLQVHYLSDQDNHTRMNHAIRSAIDEVKSLPLNDEDFGL